EGLRLPFRPLAGLAQNEEPGGADREARRRGRMGQAEMTTTRTRFTLRVDTWSPDGESIVEHVAGIEDYQGSTRHVPRRLRTLAGHADHFAPGCARDS